MTTNQHFSLRWNDYLQHITKAFDTLRSDDNFVDVTLSCEGKRIHAHKMLLSACSTYFRDILKENPCQHPIIILKNVKYDDLQALIDFMYQGEVSVVQEQLTSFLTTAELLAVQGLTNGSVDDHQIRSHGVTLQKKPAKPQQFVVAQTLRATSPSNRIKKRKLSKIHIDKEKSLRKESSEASEVSYMPLVMPNVKVEIPEYFDQSATNNISVGFDDSDIGENCEYIEETNDIKNTSDENVCTVYSPDQTDAVTHEEVENPTTSDGIQQESSLQDPFQSGQDKRFLTESIDFFDSTLRLDPISEMQRKIRNKLNRTTHGEVAKQKGDQLHFSTFASYIIDEKADPLTPPTYSELNDHGHADMSAITDLESTMTCNIVKLNLKIDQLGINIDNKLQAVLDLLQHKCSCKMEIPDVAIALYNKMPVNNFHELDDLEHMLMDPIIAQQMKTRLSRIGGIDSKNATVSLLRKVFSDAVAKDFSWVGGKGKKNFSALLMVRLIIEVVSEKPEFMATEFGVADNIRSWLRHANDRFMRNAPAPDIADVDKHM